MSKFLVFITLLAGLAIGAAWYSQREALLDAPVVSPEGVSEEWVEHLYSQNPKDVETAEQEVRELGARALPTIRRLLGDAKEDRDLRKSALKACGVLGPKASGVIPEVAALLSDPELTEEAAVALSFMGREALPPLRQALASGDPVVRSEALRSIGKLKARAPLDAAAVVPLLLTGMRDADKDVRTVAATYLGIIHEDHANTVPALVSGLADPEIEVRRASATALGAFEERAASAVPELKVAARDRDEDLAREAGLALIKVQKR